MTLPDDHQTIIEMRVTIQLMEQRISELENDVSELESDRKSFFKAGILALGAAVIGLITYIWTKHGPV